jgi:ATP/maltotriose-dependent transcriptional regulator MalT
MRSALAVALVDPASTGPELVTQLAGSVAQLNARVGAAPFVRLQLGLFPIVEACRALLRGSVPEPTRRELLATAATAYTLAARLAFETHDDPSAAYLYRDAVSVAGELPDLWRRASIRTSQTMVTLYATGDIAAAQAMAEDAVRDARRGSSVLIRARAHALQAETAARAGHRRNAFTALHVASHDLDCDTTDDPAQAAFGTGRLHGFEGVCHLYAGDADEAEHQLADAIGTLGSPRDAIQRGIVLTDLALARIRLEHPDAATELLHECVDLTASTRARAPEREYPRSESVRPGSPSALGAPNPSSPNSTTTYTPH